MTTQCPRCGAPRLGEAPFCHHCGLDFRVLGGPSMPPQQSLPPQQPIYGAPQPPAPYGAPPAPYGAQPPQQPYGAPPQQPYGAPPQQPYGQPQQQPYGQPQPPYYHPGQQPPAYQQASPWGSQWQAPQPPAAAPPTYQTPAPSQTPADAPSAADPSGVATDQATDPAVAAAAATQAAATQAAATQAPAASSVCLRCYAPLQPGYAGCGNCGFDNSIVWGALAAPATGRIPTIAYALAFLGAGLVVAAVALLLVAAH